MGTIFLLKGDPPPRNGAAGGSGGGLLDIQAAIAENAISTEHITLLNTIRGHSTRRSLGGTGGHRLGICFASAVGLARSRHVRQRKLHSAHPSRSGGVPRLGNPKWAGDSGTGGALALIAAQAAAEPSNGAAGT
jgi:hypothetical protein